MSRILHPLLLLAAKVVYAQLVRENEFLKIENKILRSRVKDKVVPTPENCRWDSGRLCQLNLDTSK
jgi:regulator of replication initiation timing